MHKVYSPFLLVQVGDSLSSSGRHVVYQRETGSLPEGHNLSTRGTQAVYRRETGCLPEGDRLSTKGRQAVC